MTPRNTIATMTIDDAAAFLRVSRSAVIRAIRLRQVPIVAGCRSAVVDRQALLAAMTTPIDGVPTDPHPRQQSNGSLRKGTQ